MNLKYYPGCLLMEYSAKKGQKTPELQGLFLILDMDDFDVRTISLYDKDEYYRPATVALVPHRDLHQRSELFQWVIQEPQRG